MHTDEHKAIRYLMKEMDPSEEMEFEKLMREDENLLIEVESLRATKRRLSGLPQQNPPENLTQNIAYEAKQIQSRRVKAKNTTYQIFKKGLAAAILLTVSFGGYYYYNMDTAAPSAERSQQSATGEAAVSPWVDRDEVLRFSENEASAVPAELQTDFTKSFEKLQLVNDPTAPQRSGSGIMLTGSPN